MKLYISYDNSSNSFDVWKKEPTWNKCENQYITKEYEWLISICPSEAMKVFPKLRKDPKEYLEFTVPKGTVWSTHE